MTNSDKIVGELTIYRRDGVFQKTYAYFKQPVTQEQKDWRTKWAKQILRREYGGSIFRKAK